MACTGMLHGLHSVLLHGLHSVLHGLHRTCTEPAQLALTDRDVAWPAQGGLRNPTRNRKPETPDPWIHKK
jgi:hypothetical protein